MGPQGRTTAWIRDKDTAWDDLGTDVGQVKFAEGWDRANLRFADVDGKLLLSWKALGLHGSC